MIPKLFSLLMVMYQNLTSPGLQFDIILPGTMKDIILFNISSSCGEGNFSLFNSLHIFTYYCVGVFPTIQYSAFQSESRFSLYYVVIN
jgi:hypothetical protein